MLPACVGKFHTCIIILLARVGNMLPARIKIELEKFLHFAFFPYMCRNTSGTLGKCRKFFSEVMVYFSNLTIAFSVLPLFILACVNHYWQVKSKVQHNTVLG